MHDPHSERMSGSETRAASGLALVFAFRMLGMFMVLPVLATYGMDLAGATPALIGLAIGAYGLTQAIFQIPFGIISDRIGRRPVIYLGLIVFALGSVLAANADSIWGVIAGRILQGAGAISAAVMALLSDLTREQHRTKAMAMIGMTHRPVVRRRHGRRAVADPRLRSVRTVPRHRRHGAGRHRHRDAFVVPQAPPDRCSIESPVWRVRR